MTRKKKTETKRPIESYEHRDKRRVNNPPVGLVTPDTDPDAGAKNSYAYDPHLDPQLQWAGKAEHTSFEVPTVSLHVHERIDPRTIIEAVRKKNGPGQPVQLPLFEEERKEPLRSAIEFYQHKHGWSNRLVAGDSLLVMNSLLEKEGMAGKVQMIYIDPPYGIKYGSNFQPFVNKRDVKDGKDEDLTAEPEQIRAFRDTWELGIHSYLTYLRDRLLLARELLTESGSIFVQIGDENVHRVRCLMDEVFEAGNFVALITFNTTTARTAKYINQVSDYCIWYARDYDRLKYRQLYIDKSVEGSHFDKIDHDGRPYYLRDLSSQGEGNKEPFEFEGKKYIPPIWLIGQPDVEVRSQSDGKYMVEVHGFDYYNTKTGGIESGGEDKIAVWLLDTDYDGRSLYPRQVFFPMAGKNEGWARLAKNLKAEIDEERIEAYRGTVSLPFEAGEHKRIAVKIVDDRGIESLKVLEVEP